MKFEEKYSKKSNPEQPSDIEVERKELFKQTTVYINAGGRGTRLDSILKPNSETGITKALIEVKGIPIVKLLSDNLLRQGFGGIIVGAGDHKNISDYYERTREASESEGRIEVINFADQLGTGGDLLRSIRREKNNISNNVLIQNVDTAVVFDTGKLLEQH